MVGRLLLSCGFVLALCGGASAALLEPGAIEVSRLLPPPPAPDSQVTHDEVAELHRIAAESTPEMVAAAARDANDQTPGMFSAVLGFDITQYPATMKLLRLVSVEDRALRAQAKAYFHRPRPWIADPSLKSCVSRLGRPSDDSYPSGHSTYGFAQGVVLASLLPDRSQVILARSAEFARNRLVCGFHYRSDTVGGQVFGTTIAMTLMRNATFKIAFDAAAAELAARP